MFRSSLGPFQYITATYNFVLTNKFKSNKPIQITKTE